jgi:ATP-citrate lyase beta-subunit
MPRQKLSEYRAKVILNQALNLHYQGWQIDGTRELKPQLKGASETSNNLVIKVDEGVKRRFKQGLVLLDIMPEDLEKGIQSLLRKGYRYLIIEPMLAHDPHEERYLSLSMHRDGLICRYTSSGGVDIESQATDIKSLFIRPGQQAHELAKGAGLTQQQLETMRNLMADNYVVFLELNPYVSREGNLYLLDAAVEVDDAALFFVDNWKAVDLRSHIGHELTIQERLVQELDASSPASLKLSVLNPNGSIFLLLSGGGASVVVADEIQNQGFGKELANYGEYSGNPNTEETYIYTKAVLQLLLRSQASKKVLFIGGAVANFTDIAKTFAGVMQAIEEVADKLQAQKVKIFVRRGGPHQEKGLAAMRTLLAQYNLLGMVHGPKTPLTTAVDEALKEAIYG